MMSLIISKLMDIMFKEVQRQMTGIGLKVIKYWKMINFMINLISLMLLIKLLPGTRNIKVMLEIGRVKMAIINNSFLLKNMIIIWLTK